MSTALNKIKPDECRIYDFTPAYVDEQINKIKLWFSKKCSDDGRLSDEYKDYIKNLDKIFVKFTPVYGFDCKLSLSSVYADVSYSYRNTYVSSTTVSGTASVNSSGDVKLSNVHSTDHYSSERVSTTNNAHWWSSATTSCITHIGTAAHSEYDLRNYEDVTDSKKIPLELNKMASAPITYEFLNPYMTPSCLPESVYNSLVKNGLGSHENASPKNIRIDRITDYHIDEFWITYLPYTYEFDVWCVFEGETYKQHCKAISEITSIGQQSEHYEKYKEILSEQRYKFGKKIKNVQTFYILSIIVSLVVLIGLVSLLVFGKQLHIEGLKHFYLPEMIALCIATVILIIVEIVATRKKREFRVIERDYDRSKSHTELDSHLQKKGAAQYKKFMTKAFVFFSVVVIFLCGFGTGTFFMCKEVRAEHFLYTPEIIGTYYGYEDGAFNKLTILSCDNEGNLEAISESTYKQYYAKSRELGKITQKDRDGVSVEFSFLEALYTPEKGHFEEKSYAHFSLDYSEVTSYSDTTMFREEKWLQLENSLTILDDELLDVYYDYSKHIANIIEINSFKGNDTLTFVNKTISKSGYTERQGEGKVLIANPDGSCFVDFVCDGTSKVGFISADHQSIAFEDEYEKNPSNVIFINSVSDFLNIKDSSANPRLFVLTQDLDFEGRSISNVSSLCGMVFGNGYTIKNFTISSFNSSASSAGLFGVIYEDAVICDLIIENAKLETTKKLSRAGLIVGYLQGTVIRVTAYGTVNATNANVVGGLIGEYSSKGKTVECNYNP